MTPDEIDWRAVYDELDHDPAEPLNYVGLAFAVETHEPGIETQDEAKQIVQAAFETGILEQTDGGYVLAAAETAVQDGGVVTSQPNETNGSTPEDDETQEEMVTIPRSEIEALQDKVDYLEAVVERNRDRYKEVGQLLGGEDEWLASVDLDQIQPFHDRMQQLEQRVSEHATTMAMLHTESESQSEPDQRALRLRLVIAEMLTPSDQKAAMDRDQCESALGGGLHRGTVLEAMKRAADGQDRDDLNGSSDLDPVPGLLFQQFDGKKQSRIVLDGKHPDLTVKDLRQNLTTQNRANRGEQ